ncbi:MAG: 4-hydroxy-3-methylbut-2-en-1-yl diphosphate synthase [Bacteroidetes bacterium]|nr:MAG: 4-hydroxy-3-methylbut-2-en-1-yl diphosphate synthase [Bacteroidota bacterium]
MENTTLPPYCEDYFDLKRFPTIEVQIGNISLGGKQAIRVQSMTTADTMDTEASVEESIRMIDAGCEIVRLTAPSKKEAENLKNIKEQLNKMGYHQPLVADIHFTPNAAEIAARIVEKVRVNPGNYADKKRFEEINYTNESYQQELARIEEKFTPLVLLCKQHGTAMRIGTNHGSLSDRILSRFGDTPEGMVESAMEFIRICVKNNFYQLVISMKASNTLVMVQAYRLLVSKMKAEGMNFPLHLGVTEAGDGEDGRIKSAVGIGALLEDGLGDTIRVSLTENPEYEIPVAQKLLQKFSSQEKFQVPTKNQELSYDAFHYTRRNSIELHNIGGKNAPVVFADLSKKQDITAANFFAFGYQYSVPLDKWNISDLAADYLYLGKRTINFEIPGTLGLVYDYEKWASLDSKKENQFALIKSTENLPEELLKETLFFLEVSSENIDFQSFNIPKNAVLVLTSEQKNKTQWFRYVRCELDRKGIQNPVILQFENNQEDAEEFQLHLSSESGVQLLDGFGDGIWLRAKQSLQAINTLSFGILQATRTRISKTEYISCPSCGRTLFDLQETTAKIRKKTSHLKGVKIGIMGCIVNGPGEMADADYGYVGTGPGKITLYKEKEVVQKNVPEDQAVDALIELIRSHGDWVEPPKD